MSTDDAEQSFQLYLRLLYKHCSGLLFPLLSTRHPQAVQRRVDDSDAVLLRQGTLLSARAGNIRHSCRNAGLYLLTVVNAPKEDDRHFYG